MGYWTPDIFELVALISSISGATVSCWVLWRTYQSLCLIKKLRVNGSLRAKAFQRMVRHFFNSLAQLVLVYVALVAVYEPPITESFQSVVSRSGATIVSLILAIKVIFDRWSELAYEWTGEERRKTDDQPPVAHP